MEPLKEERDFFAASLEEWFKLHPNKVALVKGKRLIGVFDTEANALSEGAKLFNSEPFLVRRIELEETESSAPSYTLGILCVHSS